MNLTAVLLLAAATAAGASPTVTARWSCADKGEGFAYYSGDVCVADESCEIRAPRAYVYMEGTNELRRVVAFGGVAVTNGARRAYGDALSYFRDTGVVVLSAGAGRMAEVFDGTGGRQSPVRGRKVRFRTQAGQAEVLESEATVPGPTGARGGLRGTFGN